MRKRKALKNRRQELIEKGEHFSRQEILVGYGLVCVLVVLLGIGMKLGVGYVFVGAVLSMLQVPGLYFHYKNRLYEKKRFADANVYMSHMAQTFTGSGKILTALKETRTIFTKGYMHQTLTRAITHIEKAYDVEQAEREALDVLAEEYDCERMRTLHDFMLRAQQRGGSCESEFRLLESIRQLWEKGVLKHYNTILMTRNLVTFEYFLLILVCMFMLHQFPEELKILHLPMVQGLNTFLIVCFIFLFARLDKKLCAPLLKDRKGMTEAQAEQKLSYIRKLQKKRLGVCRLKYFLTVWQVKEEIKRVFPGWLFDVLLLMQCENVAVALFKSTEKAPAILKGELEILRKELEENPSSSETYLTFLAEFQIPQVEEVMRKLYALSNGIGVKEEVMNLIMENNMTMLAEAEQQRLKIKGDLFSIYNMLPVLPVMLCMVGYGIALIFVIFRNIMTII